MSQKTKTIWFGIYSPSWSPEMQRHITAGSMSVKCYHDHPHNHHHQLHGHDDETEGQYSGKMLAETGSFDILFGNRVLGIGFFFRYT